MPATSYPSTRRALRERLLQLWGNDIVVKFDRPFSRAADYALHLGQLRQFEAEWVLQQLREHLGACYTITQNNGYLNFSMTESHLQSQVDRALEQGAAFGATGQWSGRRVSAEFVSADPIGPLSIHRGRIAVTGDALCRLLKWQGARVTREYLINDDESSSRLNLLGESILAAYSAHFGENATPPEGALDTAFVRQVARQIAERDGNRYLLVPEKEAARAFAQDACRRAIASQQQSLQALDVQFDLWVYETALINEGRVQLAIKQLQEHDAMIERDGASWIATSHWGDDADRPLIRATGAPTYLATDIAYHLFRFERGYDTLINIWSNEHQQYVKRTHAALAAAGYDDERLKVLLCAPVQWNNDGVKVSEEDAPATVDEALAAFDVNTLRLALLLRQGDAPAVLDRELLSRDDESNPAYQVQLLSARLAQIQRDNAARQVPFDKWELAQQNLARWVAQWPDEVETATAQLAPHRIAGYLQQGAKNVKHLLTAHRINEPLDDRLLTAARQVARNAFDILGVEVTEKL